MSCRHFIVFFFDRQRRSSSVLLAGGIRRARGRARCGSQLTPCVSVSIRCKRCFLRSQSATISFSCAAAPASCRRSISRCMAARSRSYRRRLSVRTQSAGVGRRPRLTGDIGHQRRPLLYLDAAKAPQVMTPTATSCRDRACRRISSVGQAIQVVRIRGPCSACHRRHRLCASDPRSAPVPRL